MASKTLCALFVLVAAACSTGEAGSGGAHATGESRATAEAPAAEGATPSDGDLGLVQARHPGCQSVGVTVLSYLSTGDTGGDPEIEQALAGERARILAQPAEARPGLARAQASNAIDRCDAAVDANIAAQHEAVEDAAWEQRRYEEQQAIEAERARIEAVYADTCSEHGGYLSDSGNCVVDYEGWPQQNVPISSEDGSFDEEQAEFNRQNCEGLRSDAEAMGEDGFSWTELPQFDERTGVCVPGVQ